MNKLWYLLIVPLCVALLCGVVVALPIIIVIVVPCTILDKVRSSHRNCKGLHVVTRSPFEATK